jgi:hypothetical protein
MEEGRKRKGLKARSHSIQTVQGRDELDEKPASNENVEQIHDSNQLE